MIDVPVSVIGRLLLNHVKTAARFWMKGIEVTYTLD